MDRCLIHILAALALSFRITPCYAQGSSDPFDQPAPLPSFERSPEAPSEKSRDNESEPAGKSEPGALQPNLLPDLEDAENKDNGLPWGWQFKHWGGSDLASGVALREGKTGGNCLKVSSGNPTDSGIISDKIAVKPGTTYRFGGWIRTTDVKADSGTRGAFITVLPTQVSAEAIQGTRDWVFVRGTVTTKDEKELQLAVGLGGRGEASGTAYFERLFLRQSAEAAKAPDVYRRPQLDAPLFNVDRLTLDKDQTLELAGLIAALVVNFPNEQVLITSEFRACALGIALRLDPRNRTAVVANGMLDAGQFPRPESQNTDLPTVWHKLDAWVGLLHSADASADDRKLGSYLGDLTRKIRPEEGFSQEFVKLHGGNNAPDWSAVLPPLPPPPAVAEIDPESVDAVVRNDPEPNPQPPPPIPNPSGNAASPEPKYRVAAKLVNDTASLLCPVQTGGTDSRAALRHMTLAWRDYAWKEEWIAGQGTVRRKVPLQNPGNTTLEIDSDWTNFSDRWNQTVRGVMGARYEGWPQGGTIDVRVPGYTSNSGSGGMLAAAICFESMVRGIKLDPKVAAVGTWNAKGALTTHSHLPGIVFGYGRDWSEILIVGPGSAEALKKVAETGVTAPFLNTQIIEVSSFRQAVEIASGKYSPELAKAITAFKAVQSVRSKMDPASLCQNRFVQDKLREISTGAPNHLSSSLLLKASTHQKPMDYSESANMLSRLYRQFDAMAASELEDVSPEDGAEAIAIFNDRLRELKPRFDRRIDKLNIRIDDAIRALEETTRMRDRTSSTAVKKLEAAQAQVRATRQAIDLVAASAGQ